MAFKFLTVANLTRFFANIEALFAARFVAKEVGKGLSTNDYTTTEKTKLDGLANTTIVDDLTSTSATSALSANQGKVLKDLVDAASGDMSGLADVATSGDYEDLLNVPTALSDFTNDAGYQTASEVETAIDTALGAFSNASIQIVEAKPATGDPGVIYLVPVDDTGSYEKWVYESGAWHDLGELALDLSGYVAESELEAITDAEIDAITAA